MGGPPFLQITQKKPKFGYCCLLVHMHVMVFRWCGPPPQFLFIWTDKMSVRPIDVRLFLVDLLHERVLAYAKPKKKEPLRLIQSNERIIFISQSSSKVIKTFYMFIKTSKFKNLQLLIFHRYKNTYKHVHMLHIWAADDRLLYFAWTWEFVCFCFSVRFLGERTNKVFFLVQREKKKRLVNWSAFRA